MSSLAPSRTAATAMALLACGSNVETAPPGEATTTAVDPVCPNGQGLQQHAPWPMDGACPNRSHRGRTTGPTSPHLLWAIDAPGKYGPGSAIHFPPIIAADGSILVTTDYMLSAIAPNGEITWSFEVDDNDGIAGAPAIGNTDAIYLPGVAKLYAIDMSGKPRWSYPYPDYGGGNNLGGLGSAAVGPDGTIYLTTVYALLAVNPDGSSRWRVPHPGGLMTSPVIGIDGTVYIWDEALHAFDPATGEHRWTFSPGDEGQPFAYMLTQAPDQRLYLPSQLGNVWSLEPSGAVVRRDVIEDCSNWVVADSDSNIRFGRDDALSYRVESRDPGGATRWSIGVAFVALGAAGANTILDRDGTLYVVGDGVSAISSSGSLVWSLSVESSYDEIWRGIALGADSTLYAALGTKLLAIGP